MVAEVGVHDDDKVAGDELQAVDVGRSEAQLAGARLEDDVGGVGLDELVGDILGSVGRAVVDDDEFPVQVAVNGGAELSAHVFTFNASLLTSHLLLCKGAVQQPCHDGEIFPLIVRRQNDRVLVFCALCRCHDFCFALEIERREKGKERRVNWR